MTLAPANIVELHRTAMGYGRQPAVLRDIDLELEPGSFHFVVGPSGAGKTSLLRLLSLCVPPRAGTLNLFGRDVSALDSAGRTATRRRLAVIFQDLRLLDHLTVVENVSLPLRIAGCTAPEATTHAQALLRWLGLEGAVATGPGDLSMGQRQLVAAARATIGRPALLLADEPTSYLDPQLSARLMRLFAQLRDLGTAVLLATHSRDLLVRYRFPVLRIEHGRVLPEPTLARAA